MYLFVDLVGLVPKNGTYPIVSGNAKNRIADRQSHNI